MDADARRMRAYVQSAAALERAWPEVRDRTATLPLRQAHAVVVEHAQRCLPTTPTGDAPRDQFLSEEDLDLRNLTWDELLRWWDYWLREAQAWNDLDQDEYSHGVFALPRSEWAEARRQAGWTHASGN